MLSNIEKSFVINAVKSPHLIKSIIEGKLVYIDTTLALKTLSASICNRKSNANIYIAKNSFRDAVISIAFRKGFHKNFQKNSMHCKFFNLYDFEVNVQLFSHIIQ